MNAGASALLIFLLVVGAFAGLGYSISEADHQAAEIQDLNSQIENLKEENQALSFSNAELTSQLEQAQQRLAREQAAQQEVQNKLQVVEAQVQEERLQNTTLLHALEIERLEKAKALADVQELTRLNTALISQLNGEMSVSTAPEAIAMELDQTSDANRVKLLGFVSPVLVILLVLLGLELHKYNILHRSQSTLLIHKAEVTKPDLSPSSPTSEAIVTVQIPQRIVPEFVKWFRQRN